MQKGKQDIIYTAADIEKYHKGLMTPQEMHALENASLDDPFLADALEGYTGHMSVQADIAELRDRLTERTREETTGVITITRKATSFSWWKIAAMVIMIAGAGIIVYQFGFSKKETGIAQGSQEKETKIIAGDSLTPAPSAAADSPAQPGDKSKEQQRSPDNTPETESSPATAGEPLPSKTQPQRNARVDEKNPAPPVSPTSLEIAAQKAEEQNADSLQDLSNIVKDIPLAAQQQQDNRAKAAKARLERDTRGYSSGNFNKTNVFRGRVTDAFNNALPFSNILNTRDSIGTYADANGFFNLVSPDSVLNVKVSSIGFEPGIIKLDYVNHNNIKLDEDKTSLAEVVVSNKKNTTNRAARSNMVLQDAEPADGWSNYDLYLANNLQEPLDFKEKKIDLSHREVELSFEVNKSGEPINITVKKSLCESCDKEAIRVLKEGPKWKRKARKGKTTVTISF